MIVTDGAPENYVDVYNKSNWPEKAVRLMPLRVCLAESVLFMCLVENVLLLCLAECSACVFG